ncbi:protein PRRC2A [Bombina bombina]|uniref:protein PRRC2A n=1 Tax=Bombina bombina TaxID=8345 RepID=UPI00235A9D14|nr:protein PRRC2A [Bombina bombina]
MTTPSDFYSPSLHTGQNAYLQQAPTQQVLSRRRQVLLSMVDSQIPVLGFGSLASVPQQPPLVTVGQAMQPLHPLSNSGRTHSNMRNETHSADTKQLDDHRRTVGGVGPCAPSAGGRTKTSNSNYGVVGSQRFVYQTALAPDTSSWTLRPWDRPNRDTDHQNSREPSNGGTPAPREP